MTAPNAGPRASDTPRTRVSIIGLGASGLAAARLALKEGGNVHVSDLRTDPATRTHADELRKLGADVELGHHDLARIEAADTVVVSPGIPPDAPVLRELRSRGVAWIGEPEFALRFLPGALIAVTGTNGKTTTTLLAAHLLRSAGFRAEAAGNVGGGLAPAASELALRPDPLDWAVLEMSSFQLADTRDLDPDIGVVTNLAPDHLDRYPNVAAYYADKARLFRNAQPRSRWVLNGESEAVRDLPGASPGNRLLFASAPDAEAGPRRPGEVGTAAFLRNGVLTLRIPRICAGRDEEEALVPASELPLLGRHNVENALAAALAARLAGASVEGIREGLRSFQPLPHRMEPVGEVDGVLWVNDSKATNVAATCTALASLDRPVLLLVGGKDKGEALEPLAAALGARRQGPGGEGQLRAVLGFGEAGPRMIEALGAGGRVVPGGLEGAVTEARRLAQPGDVVLLSPACSSFDAFPNYAARGDRFRELARGARVAS